MGILATSGTVEEAEKGRCQSKCTYSVAQPFVINLIREAQCCPYDSVGSYLTSPICRALGLPKEGPFYKKPSAGELNGFVHNTWPRYQAAFSKEYAKAVILREFEKADGLLVTVDGTPLEASHFNRDAEFNGHYMLVMDRMHIVMVNGAPIYGIQTSGNTNDSEVLGALCDLLNEHPEIRGKIKFMIDAGYDSFHCFSEVYFATGVIPQCVLRSNDVIHPEASLPALQRMYGRMYRLEGYDPYRKHDVDHVLRFLHRHGKGEYVGMYLHNCEMERQMSEGRLVLEYMEESGEEVPQDCGTSPPIPHDSGSNDSTPVRKDTDRQVCETMHHAMKRWIGFDIRGMRHCTRELVVGFKFGCCQLLSAIFQRYSNGPTI